MGDAPWLGLDFQLSRTLVSVMSLKEGLEGAPGKVEGSGVRWKITVGLEGAGREWWVSLE